MTWREGLEYWTWVWAQWGEKREQKGWTAGWELKLKDREKDRDLWGTGLKVRLKEGEGKKCQYRKEEEGTCGL